MGKLKYYVVLLMKFLLALASVNNAAEGLRLATASFTGKLSRMPGLGWIGDVEELERVDGALLFAIGLTFFLFLGWTELFGNVLMPDDQEEVGVGRRHHLIVSLAWCLGLALLDGALFYIGISEARWGQTGITWSGVALAFGFEFLVAIVAVAGVLMKQRIENLGG